ncbi:hypothetical protein T265_12112 [Opisthorchis viverrini]|uniref:Uncharacterized protein n=1 Tax=Opisthorchis viverrini TaxID=6198 RepID=A0A074YVU6_OPIVI|nr:hypothetical protein T265_12112 [Opisthorchis viverrini]KER18891.1 hypothetical protein T265_12112 [Opisthorchis viverrini]
MNFAHSRREHNIECYVNSQKRVGSRKLPPVYKSAEYFRLNFEVFGLSNLIIGKHAQRGLSANDDQASSYRLHFVLGKFLPVMDRAT